MAPQRGYSSYHGRQPGWKILLAILLVGVILAAVCVLLVQKYVVYDDTGAPHLRLPQTQEEPQSAVSSAPVSSSAAASSSAADGVNLTIEEPETARMIAVQLPESELNQWDWNALWEYRSDSAANNALAVTVKGAAGRVYYDSAAAFAATGQTAPATAAEDLSAITERSGGRYAVARITALRDPRAAKADVEGKGLKNTGGYLFYDGGSTNWLDPAKEGTRTYLSALAQECAALGFDEILLTDFSYPTEGKLNKIAYGTDARAETLTACLQTLRTSLTPSGVKLSVELPAQTVLTGADAVSGQSLEGLAPLVDRIYAAAAPEEIPALAAAVSAVNPDCEFVAELTGTDTVESSALYSAP